MNTQHMNALSLADKMKAAALTGGWSYGKTVQTSIDVTTYARITPGMLQRWLANNWWDELQTAWAAEANNQEVVIRLPKMLADRLDAGTQNVRFHSFLLVFDLEADNVVEMAEVVFPEEQPVSLAAILYTTYCEAVGGVAWNGDRLPAWCDFSRDVSKQKQVQAWEKVAWTTLEYARGVGPCVTTDPVEAAITRVKEMQEHPPQSPVPAGNGLFIVLEGIDGSGKTTQLQMLRDHFEKLGRKVFCLREPGGTPLGEDLRSLLKDPSFTICNTAELLMFLAARAQLLSQVVGPALADDYVVLLDRFSPSTIAYQGYGRGMGTQTVRRMAAFAETITPHYTFWIDLPLSVARERLSGSPADKFDQLDDAFFECVIAGYLSCQDTYPGFRRVQGNTTPEAVHQDILSQLEAAQTPVPT